MTLPGGPADKLGNRYEKWWTVDALVRMLEGIGDSIRIEAPGFEKTEFVVWIGSQRHLHQVKRDHPNGKWSLNALKNDGLLGAIGDQLQDNGDRFIFVSGSDAPELKDLSESARKAESESEFQEFWLASEQRKQRLQMLLKVWGCEVSTALARLQRVEVHTISENELKEKVERGVQALFGADSASALTLLRAIAEDSVQRRINFDDLLEKLSERGLTPRYVNNPAQARNVLTERTNSYLGSVGKRLIQRRLVSQTVTQEVLARTWTRNPATTCYMPSARSESRRSNEPSNGTRSNSSPSGNGFSAKGTSGSPRSTWTNSPSAARFKTCVSTDSKRAATTPFSRPISMTKHAVRNLPVPRGLNAYPVVAASHE